MAKFSQSLLTAKASGRIPVIADIKCRSPQHGDLLRGRDPVACAEMLAHDGAPALSVVTEPLRFGGSLELLERIVKATSLPILRKDFVETTDDLMRTRDAGATAILLMIAVLPEATLETLYSKSLELGLEPLIEVHTTEEMAIAKQLGATLIGINNRDITKWECDDGTVQTTQHLIRHAPLGATLISESGITTPADVRAAIQAGCTAVLIGTALWQAPDLRQAFAELRFLTPPSEPRP
jgi:indole-3-glycerol phosphate synthase